MVHQASVACHSNRVTIRSPHLEIQAANLLEFLDASTSPPPPITVTIIRNFVGTFVLLDPALSLSYVALLNPLPKMTIQREPWIEEQRIEGQDPHPGSGSGPSRSGPPDTAPKQEVDETHGLQSAEIPEETMPTSHPATSGLTELQPPALDQGETHHERDESTMASIKGEDLDSFTERTDQGHNSSTLPPSLLVSDESSHIELPDPAELVQPVTPSIGQMTHDFAATAYLDPSTIGDEADTPTVPKPFMPDQTLGGTESASQKRIPVPNSQNDDTPTSTDLNCAQPFQQNPITAAPSEAGTSDAVNNVIADAPRAVHPSISGDSLNTKATTQLPSVTAEDWNNPQDTSMAHRPGPMQDADVEIFQKQASETAQVAKRRSTEVATPEDEAATNRKSRRLIEKSATPAPAPKPEPELKRAPSKRNPRRPVPIDPAMAAAKAAKAKAQAAKIVKAATEKQKSKFSTIHDFAIT